MKPAVLLFAAFITGVITLSSSSSFKNIQGTWVMQSDNSPCSNNVLRIKMEEGIWAGKIDIPEQDIYDKEVFSIITKADSVFITVVKDGPVIKTAFVNDSTLTGELLVDGRPGFIKFLKQKNS